jgi:HPt (histidine-containing phosphotransfer) domain-containing protein
MPAVDLAQLSRFTGGDRSVNSDVLNLFLDQSSAMLARLETALSRHDLADWKVAAHTLKGGSRGIGADGLAGAAASLELLDPADFERAARALRDLKTHLAATNAFIKAYLGR